MSIEKHAPTKSNDQLAAARVRAVTTLLATLRKVALSNTRTACLVKQALGRYDRAMSASIRPNPDAGLDVDKVLAHFYDEARGELSPSPEQQVIDASYAAYERYKKAPHLFSALGKLTYPQWLNVKSLRLKLTPDTPGPVPLPKRVERLSVIDWNAHEMAMVRTDAPSQHATTCAPSAWEDCQSHDPMGD